MLTLITLRPCKTRFTQAAEGAPLAVTATPLATGGRLLHGGAVIINNSAAWQSAGGFSRGTKVIELNGRTGEKCEEEKISVNGRK